MPRMTASRHLIGKDSRVISFAVSINLQERAQQGISRLISSCSQSVCQSVSVPVSTLGAMQDYRGKGESSPWRLEPKYICTSRTKFLNSPLLSPRVSSWRLVPIFHGILPLPQDKGHYKEKVKEAT